MTTVRPYVDDTDRLDNGPERDRVVAGLARTDTDHYLGKLGWAKGKTTGGRRTLVDAAGATIATTIEGSPNLYRIADDVVVTHLGQSTSLSANYVIDLVDLVSLATGHPTHDALSKLSANLDAREAKLVADAQKKTEREREQKIAERELFYEADEVAKRRRDEKKLAAGYAEGEAPGDSWLGDDEDDEAVLAEVFDDAYEGMKATIFEREDKQPMFYPATVSTIFGEPGSGKSWITFTACAREVKAGRPACYLDFEGSKRSAYRRMRQLGCTAEQLRRCFVYRGPKDHPAKPEPGDTDSIRAAIRQRFIDTVTAVVAGRRFSLVVVDGVTNAMAIAGYKVNDNGEATLWDHEVPRTIVEKSGAAVVTVDHVSKNAGQTRFAGGAGAKLANVSGIAVRAERVRDDAGGTIVRCALYVTKDREGDVESSCQYSETGGGDMFGHFLLQTDNNRTVGKLSGLDGVVVTPDGAKKWEKGEKAKQADEALSQSKHLIDRARHDVGDALSQTLVVAIVVAHFFENGATFAELRGLLDNEGPETKKWIKGNERDRLAKAVRQGYMTKGRERGSGKNRGPAYHPVENFLDEVEAAAQGFVKYLTDPPEAPAESDDFASI